MHHLTLEDLARLVDEEPTSEERAHLESCERCAADLDALTVQTGLLGQLPDPVPPQGLHWRIKQALVTEPPAPAASGWWEHAWLRAAAGIALFVLGGTVGTFGVAPRLAARSAEPRAPGVVLAEVETPEEAVASLAEAEAQYLRALSEFAQYNFAVAGADPLNRLAALENIVLMTGAALREAPADPVINNFHLTALGQREALLRQLEEAGDPIEWF